MEKKITISLSEGNCAYISGEGLEGIKFQNICTKTDLLSAVEDYISNYTRYSFLEDSISDEKVRGKIENLLSKLHINVNSKGFFYLVDAIYMVRENTMLIANSVELYSRVAEKHNVSPASVERMMRYAYQKGLSYGYVPEEFHFLRSYMEAGMLPKTRTFIYEIAKML